MVKDIKLRKGCVSGFSRQEEATVKWASTRENLSLEVCEQHRRRPACASAQTDQRLCYSDLESIISKLATSKMSIFQLVSVAEETGLKFALWETPKTSFLATRHNWHLTAHIMSVVQSIKKTITSTMMCNIMV